MGKVPRFYVPSSSIEGKQIHLTDWIVRHAIHVLRLSPGEKLSFFDGEGHEFLATLTPIAKKKYIGKIDEILPPSPELTTQFMLYQAPLQPTRWEWLLEKATELGVSAITPLITRFSDMDIHKNFPSKKTRWEKIMQSACEQCGRSIVPKILPPAHFPEALKAAPGKRVLFYEDFKEAVPLKTLLYSGISNVIPEPRPHRGRGAKAGIQDSVISIFIGPKGGFSKEEIALAQSLSVPIVSMGKLVLRAETAGIAALAILALDG